MWGSWWEGATGFLDWDIAAWTIDDPWGPAIDWGKTGDGVLLYPGNHDGLDAPAGSPEGIAVDGPIPSYRLKIVRQGLQDWALFALADQVGLGDFARAKVSQVYGQFGGCDWQGCDAPILGYWWSSDEALMDDVREDVAEAIIAAE
jgi:hypothetical protein